MTSTQPGSSLTTSDASPCQKTPDGHTAVSVRPTCTKAVLRVPRNAVIVGVIWVMSALAALCASHFGRYAIATMSGDWAQQMYLVETDYHNIGLPTNSHDRVVDEGLNGTGANYPHLTHFLVAYTSHLLDLNPLRSMEVWAIIGLLSGCLIMAARLTFLCGEIPSLLALLFTVVWLWTCSYVGFGLRGHVEGNFFFAQFIGTVLALAGLAVLERIRSTGIPVLLGIVLWGGVLANAHLVPAVWFTLAALIRLALSGRSLRLALIKCAGVTVGFAVVATGGATRAMLQVASNNGWFLIRNAQLSDHAVSLAIGLAFVLAAVIAVIIYLVLTQPWEQLRHTLMAYAGLISVGGLISLQGFCYFVLHFGSVYAIAKYTYLLALEIGLLIVSIPYPVNSVVERFFQRRPALAFMSCIIAFFAAQLPFISTPDDQDLLIKVRERLLDLGIKYNPQHRVYPEFSAFDYDRNFYLAIAVIRIPRDDRTFKWLLRAAQGEEAFAWPRNADFAPLTAGENAAISPISSLSYKYSVHLTPVEGKQLAPMTYQIGRPNLLKIDIDDPDQGRFELATSIPAPKGFVLLGYHTFDKFSKQLQDGRCLLTRNGTIWHAEIPLSSMEPPIASIEFSPVREWMTWFFWQQQPNIRRLVFVDSAEIKSPMRPTAESPR